MLIKKKRIILKVIREQKLYINKIKHPHTNAVNKSNQV